MHLRGRPHRLDHLVAPVILGTLAAVIGTGAGWLARDARATEPAEPANPAIEHTVREFIAAFNDGDPHRLEALTCGILEQRLREQREDAPDRPSWTASTHMTVSDLHATAVDGRRAMILGRVELPGSGSDIHRNGSTVVFGLENTDRWRLCWYTQVPE
ncbi:hypothetical protein ACWDOP_00415 [Nocardia sp. NPDC003693]